MKRIQSRIGCGSLLIVLLLGGGNLSAQIPIIGIIGEAAKKIVVAIDIRVQRLQTETIGLQIAAKELENAMALSQLTAITDWVQQQKDLYAGYYTELWQIKNAISAYERVKEMISKEAQIVAQCKQMNGMIRQDAHFTVAEADGMAMVLTGILQESVAAIGQLYLVVNAFVTQMQDGDRLRLIDEAAGRIDRNYTDLQQFSQRSTLLSLERAQDEHDRAVTRSLYGLQ